MYRASLTRLLRSVLAFECWGLNQKTFVHHVCSSNVMPLSGFSRVLANRSFSKTSSREDNNVVNQSSKPSGRLEEVALSEVIFAMRNLPGVFEVYENFKDSCPMVQRNRVAILYCVTNIVQKVRGQKDILTSDGSLDGKRGLFLELLGEITNHISDSSDRDLALILWSTGKVGVDQGMIHDLARACEREILYRDVTSFDIAALNQILTGLAFCNMKDSMLLSKVEKAILSGEIKLSDFSNLELVGSLMTFSKSRNVTSELFECYREAIYLRNMSSFEDYELSQLIFAFARKGVEAEKLFSFTKQEILQRGVTSFLCKNQFLIPWAFANSKSNRRYHKIFRLIDEEFVLHGVQGCASDFLSNLVWCFTKVGLYDSRVYDLVKDEVLVRGLNSFFGCTVHLLWSYARAKGSSYPDLSDKVVSWFLSSDFKAVGNKDLCLYTWCFQKLGIRNETVYQAVEMELLQRRVSNLNFSHLNQLLSGFAFAKTGSREFLDYLEKVVLKLDFSALKTFQIVSLIRLFAEMNFRTSHLFDVAEKELIQRGKSQVALKEIKKQ